MYDSLGFRKTADIMAASCLAYSIVFFVFNVGFSISSDEKKIKSKMETLKYQQNQKRESTFYSHNLYNLYDHQIYLHHNGDDIITNSNPIHEKECIRKL